MANMEHAMKQLSKFLLKMKTKPGIESTDKDNIETKMFLAELEAVLDAHKAEKAAEAVRKAAEAARNAEVWDAAKICQKWEDDAQSLASRLKGSGLSYSLSPKLHFNFE